ncbi:hypothetical protein COBT_003175, partial [Conglomerata obtusa]
LVCNDKTYVRRVFESTGGIRLSPENYLNYITKVLSYLKLDKPDEIKLIDKSITSGTVDDDYIESEKLYKNWKDNDILFCFSFKEKDLEEALKEQKIYYVITGLESAIDIQIKFMSVDSNFINTRQKRPETNLLDYIESDIDIRELGNVAYELGEHNAFKHEDESASYYVETLSDSIAHLMYIALDKGHNCM